MTVLALFLAEHGSHGPVLLDPESWGLVFWTACTFAAVLFILKKTAWGPIIESLEKRERTIEDQIKAVRDSMKNMKDPIQQFFATGQVSLLQARPETVWSNRASTASAAASGLHGPTQPDTTWTTTNVGESVPGVPTPLGWSVWSVAGEIAMRSAFHAVGALSNRELELPDQQEDWLLGIFYGRAALSVSLVCEWSERVPGIDPVAMAEQIFSARPSGYVARRQRRYYPRVAVKAVQPMLRVQSMVAADRHDAEAFRAMTLAELTTAGEARTRVLLDEAIELHRRCL